MRPCKPRNCADVAEGTAKGRYSAHRLWACEAACSVGSRTSRPAASALARPPGGKENDEVRSQNQGRPLSSVVRRAASQPAADRVLVHARKLCNLMDRIGAVPLEVASIEPLHLRTPFATSQDLILAPRRCAGTELYRPRNRPDHAGPPRRFADGDRRGPGAGGGDVVDWQVRSSRLRCVGSERAQSRYATGEPRWFAAITGARSAEVGWLGNRRHADGAAYPPIWRLSISEGKLIKRRQANFPQSQHLIHSLGEEFSTRTIGGLSREKPQEGRRRTSAALLT
jgi:hypothetical protein